MTIQRLPVVPGQDAWRRTQQSVNQLASAVDNLCVNVRDFGATGSSDDTAAIQAAIDSLPNGGRIYFPEGTYTITAALNVAWQGIYFEGASRNATVIQQKTLNAGIINVASTGNFFSLSGLRLAYSGGTPTSGATAIHMQSSYNHLRDFTIANSYVGIEINNAAVAIKITDFESLNYESIGLYAHNCSDIYISRFIFNCGNSTRGALGGLRLVDKAEAILVCNGDILNGVFSMTTDATVYAANARPAYSKFTNVFFDSSTSGVSLTNAVEIDFDSCWFSNRPGNGITLTSVDGVRFTGGGAINCAGHGVVVQSSAVRVVFNGFSARGNSTGAANTSDGISIAAGTTDFVVTHCILGGSLSFGSQRYGVNVNTGASDRYIVADNLVTGNSTGGVNDGGTGTNKRVANNY